MSEAGAAAALFTGDGAMAARGREVDWAKTALGPVTDWPEALKNTVCVILATRHPAMIAWGPKLVAIPNDAYVALLKDARHARIMGAPIRETFADLWPYLEPKLAPVLAGKGATWTESEPIAVTYPDGTPGIRYWTYSHSPLPDPAAPQGIGGMLLLGQDVTDTVVAAQDKDAALAALGESEERFRRIADSAPVPIWVTLLDRTRGFVNQAYLKFLGRPYEEALKFDWRSIIHPDDVDRIVAESIMGEATLKPFVLEGRYHGAQGWRWLRSESSPRFGPDGAHIGFIGVAHDVTAAKDAEAALRELNETLEARVAAETAERVRAEETLRQAQKLESLGQLTGGIAHDFNNYLTVILQSAAMLKRPDLPRERKDRYVEAIGDTAQRAAELTGQLLAFARRAPHATEAFDAGEKLGAMRPMLATLAGERVRLTMDCAPGCFVDTDPAQLQSAIVNLTANARDAMPGGGALDIASRCGDGRVEITITDTGQGIPPDKLETVFEPFFTTKAVGKGTGLGLSQVYGFAQASGGSVRVESEEGRGARFILTLPAATRSAAPRDTAAPVDLAAVRPLSVLLVEDNHAVAEVTRQMLADAGHRVTLCPHGDAAIAYIGAVEFDVVLSDVVMPGPVDGLALARRCREAGLPVILATGYSQRLADDAGHGFEVLRKPYTPDQLGAAIARVTAT